MVLFQVPFSQAIARLDGSSAVDWSQRQMPAIRWMGGGRQSPGWASPSVVAWAPAGRPEAGALRAAESTSGGWSTTSSAGADLARQLPPEVGPGRAMRELETSLQQFGEFVLKPQLVKEKAASTTRMVFIDDLCERRD